MSERVILAHGEGASPVSVHRSPVENHANHSRRISQTAERLSLAFAGLLVLFIGLLAYETWVDLTRRSEQVEITQQVIGNTNTLLSSLKDAETGQRGFLITGEDRYLEPYQQALTEVPATLDRLSTVPDGRRPDQAARVERLKPLVKDKLDELGNTIEIRRRQGVDAALAIVRTDRGKAIMDQIRAICAEIQSVANQRLTRYSDDARASANNLGLISSIGSLGLLILLVIATATIQRGTRRREQLIDSLDRSEAQTRQSRDWLQTALNSIGDAVIATDARGQVSFLNAVAQSLTGWKQEEAAGKPLEQVFVIRNEDTGREVENPVSKVLREGSIVGLANHTKLIARDGRHIPIDDSAAPIRDAAGKTAGVVLVFRDITAQRQAEAATRLMASIVESSDDAIIGKDLNGVITTWNRGAERIFGYSAAEAVGKSISILAVPGKPDQMPGILQRIRNGERIDHFDTVRVTKSGNLVNISLTVSPVYDAAGQIVGASKIARDITEQLRARALIAELAERLRITLGSIGDAVIATDSAGAVTYMNPVAENLTGWSLADATGKPLLEVFRIINEETRQPVDNPVFKVLREGRVVGLANHTVLIARSGQECAIDDSAAPIRDGDGNVVGVVMVFRDNTAPREAEERLRLAVEAAPNAMIMVDTDGRIELVNAQTKKLFGYERRELLGQPVEMLVPDRYRGGHHALRAEFLREPAARPMGAGRDLFGLRKDGTEVPIEIGLNPITTSQGDFVLTAIIDISERKRAEERLKESQAQFKRLIESNIVGIVIANEKRVVDANDVYLNMLGCSREDLLAGRADWVKATPPDSYQKDLHAIRELREHGFCAPYEKEYVRPDGSRCPILIGVAALPGYAELTWICVVLDMSDQQRLQDALMSANKKLTRANEDLEQFAYSASHDLQEPLRMITSYSQLLLKGYRGQLDGEAATCIQFITQGTRRMRELLRDLLAYTQLTGERQEPVAPVDLNEVFEATLQDHQAAIQESGAIVTSDPLPAILGHKPHFVQLFQNLIGNALKYRGERPPRIHVSAQTQNGLWRIAVKDNGIGIAPEYHKHIFGVFKRLHGSIPGTGIGLAICQRVVDRYGGQIWVESQAGQGATFYFTLPAAKGAVAQDA